jgi:hypothetical protein
MFARYTVAVMLFVAPLSALAAHPVCNGSHGQVVACSANEDAYWRAYNAGIPAFCQGIAAKIPDDPVAKEPASNWAPERTRKFVVGECMGHQMHFTLP